MKIAEKPKNEIERLKALRDYEIMDTPKELAYEEIVLLASSICNAPISLICLLDETRQWFKAQIGLPIQEAPRHLVFCQYTLLGDDLHIVPDLTKDDRFFDNPYVTGDLGCRFYAGAPLITSDGCALGTLCVIDKQPRELTEYQLKSLRALTR